MIIGIYDRGLISHLTVSQYGSSPSRHLLVKELRIKVILFLHKESGRNVYLELILFIFFLVSSYR